MMSVTFHGVKHVMAQSQPRTFALVLALLVSMAMGIPHQGRHANLEAAPPTGFEAGSHDHAIDVGPGGYLVRRDPLAESLADMQKAHAGNKEDPDPAEVEQDGSVTVVAPAMTSSEQVKLEELTEECMMEEPTSECMEKFGSYGIRRLFTESFGNIQKLKLTRDGWMSHPAVQKRKFYDVTLPGSVNSGTYAITGDSAVATANPYGTVSQNLNLYHQLELGIRAFDIRVGYSSDSQLVYVSHGSLMVPISLAMQDIRRYLEEHTREVVVLDVKKDPKGDPSHMQALVEEEKNPKRIPGQLVHEAIACELKEMIAKYSVLNKLPDGEIAENPTIGALTDVGGQVMYFWEGQQVLCTTFQECSQTPGWYPPEGGSSLAFGQPFAMGTRKAKSGSKADDRMIEPACMAPSLSYTTSEEPEGLLKKMHTWSMDAPGQIVKNLPACFPKGGKVPAEHEPTLWYALDAFVTPSAEESTIQNDRMRGVKAIYTRGEGFTVKTEAERTNYLVLSWFLQKKAQQIFTKPNAIMMEFASAASIGIIRIVEAMQSRPECGWAIYCKDSGSCWADTLLGEQDKCLVEAEVVKKLQEHADGAVDTTNWIIYVTICLGSIALLCFLSAFTRFIMKTMHAPAKTIESQGESAYEGGTRGKLAFEGGTPQADTDENTMDDALVDNREDATEDPPPEDRGF